MNTLTNVRPVFLPFSLYFTCQRNNKRLDQNKASRINAARDRIEPTLDELPLKTVIFYFLRRVRARTGISIFTSINCRSFFPHPAVLFI